MQISAWETNGYIMIIACTVQRLYDGYMMVILYQSLLWLVYVLLIQQQEVDPRYE